MKTKYQAPLPALAAAVAIVAAFSVAVLFSPLALAKSTKTISYRFDQVWSTTIRFLRADRGYRITDKDRESGFILFVYPGEGAVKECSASLEIVHIVDDAGFQKIRVQLSIAHQPSYIEVHLLDTLEQKLFEEQGQPPAPSPARKPDSDDPSKKSPRGK